MVAHQKEGGAKDMRGGGKKNLYVREAGVRGCCHQRVERPHDLPGDGAQAATLNERIFKLKEEP